VNQKSDNIFSLSLEDVDRTIEDLVGGKEKRV
jgi:hypothetical protein